MTLISIVQLGTVEYATGLQLQQKLVELRKQGRIGDVLLLLEHPPVITRGRNAKAGNILASPELLAERGVEVFECDRGGDVTFHGPGQLVGYPIFDLRALPSPEGERQTLGVIAYVRRLEEVLLRACADFGIPATRIPGLTGVWTREARAPRGPTRPEAKIAALGVHVSRAVTSHGFALNVNSDLSYFDLIVPCGIHAKPVTSMAEALGREIALSDVAHSVARNFGVVFETEILWLEDLDSLVGTVVGVPMKPPKEFRKMHREEDTPWG